MKAVAIVIGGLLVVAVVLVATFREQPAAMQQYNNYIRVTGGEPLVRIHSSDESSVAPVTRQLSEAVLVGPSATEPMPLILDRF